MIYNIYDKYIYNKIKMIVEHIHINNQMLALGVFQV